jgi:hypothetical protein
MGKQTFAEETQSTMRVDRTEEEVDEVSPWYGYGQDDTGDLPPDEGGALSPRQQAGSDGDAFFAFIREKHLDEAKEFRRQGYNSQVPEVDSGLLPQLRAAVEISSRLIHLHAHEGGPRGRSWLLEKISELEKFIKRLSGEAIKEWVNDELTKEHLFASGPDAAQNKSAAQSLVRRLASTLQTLTRVAQALGAVVDYSTPENLHGAVREGLVNELTDAIAPDDRESVTQALGRMIADAADNAAWSRLMDTRVTAWAANKPATFDAVIAAARRDADKANKKARVLSGNAQAFFSDIAAFLLSLSIELKAERSASGQEAVGETSEEETRDDTTAARKERLKGLVKKLKTRVRQGKVQLGIVGTTFSKYGRGAARVIQHGEISATPSKSAERGVADSITRSILWQWQQPTIKLQHASGAILAKVTELKKIKGLFSADATANASGNAEENADILAGEPHEDDRDMQVRQWVNERIEQEQPAGQRAAKLAVLSQLLEGDIANARKLVTRLGNTQGSIENMLKRQRAAVVNMIYQRRSADLDTELKAVNKLLPEIARKLTDTVAALEKALQAAEQPGRDFSAAKMQAHEAQLLATKAKEWISTRSIWQTERPLDENSRGTRLAKHWANLAKERHSGPWQAPDAKGVWTSLKNQGLLEATLSHGDPEGYLFATRLAGELENARNDELKLPMSPDEYVALEKSLVEFIVSWGQKRVARGGARLVVELSFEQAVDTVTFGLSSMLRVPYKVLKATIKIPYRVNKVNNYTMPGQDRPYKAMYAMLGKKLKQLGFNLVTAPVPGVIKLPIGAALTAGAALYNQQLEAKEKTFSAVYERVTQGKKSEKIKMGSVPGMLFDSGTDAGFMSGVKGIRKVGVAIPKVINAQLIPEDEEEWEKITLNSGGVIVIEGDRAFHSAVRRHIEELQKHPSGRALLERLKHHEIEIRPPHDEDWLRTELDGQHYFGSRVVGNTIYFDPYNTYYGSDREEQAEDWRDLHPSIVLFHELLHLDSGDTGHDTIIPSDPDRLDENDYRREFYDSRGQQVITRPFAEYHAEGDRDVARYAPKRSSLRNEFEQTVSAHGYKKLPQDKKRLTYFYATNNILQQIQNDQSLPRQAQRNAYNARIGISNLVPVDFYGYTMTNTFFIPDSPGAKTGVLINLDNESNPYTYIKSGSDIPAGLRSNFPASAKQAGLWKSNGFEAFDQIRQGNWDFGTYFNYNAPTGKNIYQLSEQLATGIEEKYRERPTQDHNRQVVEKAIVGSQIPELDVSATPVDYKLEFTWAALTPSEYLRAFARPFETLSGQGQLIASHINGDSIETTERKVEQAKYIGAWVDVTVGTLTSFTGAGIVLGAAQSAAEIGADVAEGKAPDPLAVGGLVLNCLPGGKIAGKIGKFSKVGEKSFKFFLQFGRKTVDLAEMGLAIEQAIKTGDPLAIYQALLASGMNAAEAHGTSQKIWAQVSKKGTGAEGNTQTGTSVKPQQSPTGVKEQKTPQQKTPQPTPPLAASGRKFKVGQTEMLGRKTGKSIEISLDGGVTWKKGGNIHMLAFTLQNAGGKSKLPKEREVGKDSVAEQPNSIGQGQKKARSDAEAEFTRHVENEGDPEQYFANIKTTAPNEKIKTFKFFNHVRQGRVRDGVFEVSKDNGVTWNKGGWLQEAVYRFRGRGKISSTELDKLISQASRQDPTGYSLICYRGALNDAQQAGVISRGANNWLINTVAKPDSSGEIMNSDNYRQAFGLQNKQSMTDFSSANITESGFMHVGERQSDGTIRYDHVVYVHVDKNGTYLYQVNGSDFLLALNGPDDLNANNNIGKGVSKSHYKHKMDEGRINLFDQYFNPQENTSGSQPVFTFTPAGEVQEAYVRHTQAESTAGKGTSSKLGANERRGGQADTGSGGGRSISSGTVATDSYAGARIPLGDNRGGPVRSSLGQPLYGKDNPLSKPRHDGSKTGPWPDAQGTMPEGTPIDTQRTTDDPWPHAQGTMPEGTSIEIPQTTNTPWTGVHGTMDDGKTVQDHTSANERRGGQTDGDDSVTSVGKTSAKGELLFDLEPQSSTSADSKVQQQRSNMVYPLDNDGGGSRHYSPQQGDHFHQPFGSDSYIEMGPNNNTVIIRAHGYPGDTGHYTAEGVAAVIRSYLASKGIRLQDIRHIELQSCYGRTLGRFSQAQSIANNLQVKVKGYSGKFTEARGNDPSDGSFSKPHRNPAVKAASNAGNTVVFHVSEAVLSVRRRLGIGASSSTQAGSTGSYALTHASGNGGRVRGRRGGRGQTVIPNGFNVMSLGKSSAGDSAQTGNVATRYIDGYTGAGANRPATRPIVPTDRSTFKPGSSAHRPDEPMITGNDLTSSRPVTDAFGQVFLRLMQDVPPHSKGKAGVLIGGMLLLGGVGLYAGKLDYDADEARSALENAEKNLSDLKAIMDSDDPEAKAELQTILQHYFGNENLSSEDIEGLIVFIRKVRTTATDAELRQLVSGTLPERLSDDVPAVFARFSPQWIIGFYMHIFGESEEGGDNSAIPGRGVVPIGSTSRDSQDSGNAKRPFTVVHTSTTNRVAGIRIIRPQQTTTLPPNKG